MIIDEGSSSRYGGTILSETLMPPCSDHGRPTIQSLTSARCDNTSPLSRAWNVSLVWASNVKASSAHVTYCSSVATILIDSNPANTAVAKKMLLTWRQWHGPHALVLTSATVQAMNDDLKVGSGRTVLRTIAEIFRPVLTLSQSHAVSR